MARVSQITIIGLGLIGGSLGLAIRQKGLARRVVGLSRSRATVREAIRRGLIDWGTTDPGAALREADLVVVATPVDEIVPTIRRSRPFLRPGCVVTDVGSTKAEVVRAAERAVPKHAVFVGAHPLAGSHARGVRAAQRGLFHGSTCIVTRTPRTRADALGIVKALWRPLVGRVIVMTPAAHDQRLAEISHLPHALAFGLMHATTSQALALAPRSFLDATRVAMSDPDVWDDIFVSNRAAISAALVRLERSLKTFRAGLRRDRSSLKRYLQHAQQRRHTLHDSTDQRRSS